MDFRCLFLRTAEAFWKPQTFLRLLHQQQPRAAVAACETRGAESAALRCPLPPLHHWHGGGGRQEACPAWSKFSSSAGERTYVSPVRNSNINISIVKGLVRAFVLFCFFQIQVSLNHHIKYEAEKFLIGSIRVQESLCLSAEVQKTWSSLSDHKGLAPKLS